MQACVAAKCFPVDDVPMAFALLAGLFWMQYIVAVAALCGVLTSLVGACRVLIGGTAAAGPAGGMAGNVSIRANHRNIPALLSGSELEALSVPALPTLLTCVAAQSECSAFRRSLCHRAAAPTLPH